MSHLSVAFFTSTPHPRRVAIRLARRRRNAPESAAARPRPKAARTLARNRRGGQRRTAEMRSASARVKPAKPTASKKKEPKARSARLERRSRAASGSGDSEKRSRIAVRMRFSTLLYVSPMTALKGEIISPITYSGASWSSMSSRPSRPSPGESAQRCPRPAGCAGRLRRRCGPWVWPFQRATRASPWAISSISTSSGDGSSRSSRLPDSIRCQARSGLRLARLHAAHR